VASLSGTLSCITSATATSPVGSYPINCSGLTSTNYTLNYAPGTLTVTPATLTITAPNASRIWGFANPVFTPTATGLVTPPDTLASLGVSCTSPATATSAIGRYAITCSGVTSANYTVGYVAGTLTVTTAVQLTPASLVFAIQNIGTTSRPRPQP
jgi:MBG domain (YGX type)